MKFLFIFFSLCILFFTSNAQLPSNLKAHYPFNGNFNDTLGVNTPGVNTGSVFVTDKFNKPFRAVKFNGTNPDYINLGTDLSFSTTSIACWINPENKKAEMLYLSNVYNQYQYTTTGIELRVDAAGKIVVFIGNASNPPASWRTYTSFASVTFGEWTHVNVVIDNFTSIKIYINGDLDLASSITGVTYTKDVNRMHVGARANPPTENPYWGMLDELMIFNKALTATEAVKVYSVSNGINGYRQSKNTISLTNPATSGHFQVLGLTSETEATLDMYNMLGEKVATYTKRAGDITCDVSKLSRGIYQVMISSGERTSSQKLIIE